METRILGNVSIHGSVRLAQNEAGFPANPQIGTIIVKDQCIYAYIKIGGLETWYPFASRTNSYVHVQGLPALVWEINHGLGTMDVWSQVKDDSGNIVQALVTAVDADNATISFTAPITGTAVIVAPDTIDVPEVKAVSINVANSAVIIDSSGVRIDGSYALTAANIETYAQAAVQGEADIRAASDNTLQNNITAESTARANADAILQSAINNNIDQAVKTTSTPQFAGLKLTGHVVPNTDIAFDLGSANKRFRDLYLSGSTIHLGDGKISYNATTNTFDLLNPQSAPAKTSLGANTTDDLAEGSTRLYFTTARAQALIDVETTARQLADNALQTLIGEKQNILGFTPENIANRGVANGYASLGSDGKVPAAQLPSYVDDVVEYTNLSGFPTTGEAAKIYVALDTNKTYRWSGTAYIQITSGAVDSVAGKSGAVTLDKSDVGLSAVDNTADNVKSVLSASRLTTARSIGGTSFDGQSNIDISYTNLIDKPTLGTAASKDTPTSGNATASQVVLGNDTRLSDARTPTAHDQDWSTITSTPTTLAGYGITDAQAADADLTAIAGLSGTTGLLKKTAANTWSLDTNTYLTANQSITVSGDVSGTGSTAIALTLANSGVVAGTYNNSATTVTPLTVDAKGRITSTGSAVTITPAWSDITSKPTTLAGYGITDAATINSPEFTGTPVAPTASAGTNTTQIATTAFVSTAVTTADNALQTLIGEKQDTLGFTPENIINRGVANGYASLGSDGKIPATQLPSYVDDVLEYTNLSGFPITGETAKIYVALDTNKTYRWSGSTYIQISSGAVDSVAGKTGVISLDKSDVGLSAVDNTADNVKSVLSASRLTTARSIGGTSFDGQSNIDISFTNLIDKPTLGTAASKDTPVTGNATASQVVLGDDTRLSDARTPTAHNQSWNTITNTPTTAAGYGITDVAPSSHVGSGGTAHSVATTLVDGFMSSTDKSKLNDIADNANNYVHPTTDGNLHVPATGTTNTGKVLTAGATAGSFSWQTLSKDSVNLSNVDNTSDVNKPISTATQAALDLKEPTITKSIGFAKWNGTAWEFVSDPASNTSETDPIFTASPAFDITNQDITAWNTAVSWGNHASAGYLTSTSIGSTVQAYDADLTNWASKTAPTGTVVGTSDTQTLTNKTLTSPTVSRITLNDGFTEEVFAVSGITPTLSPGNGSIQTWTLTGNSTPTTGTWAAGQSIILAIDDGSSYTITWPGITWVVPSGLPPVLAADTITWIIIWKVGTVLYGKY